MLSEIQGKDKEMKEESKSGKKFWSLKESKITKISGGILVAILASIFIVQEVLDYREIKALEKPFKITHTAFEFESNGQTIEENGKVYDLGHLVTREIHLTTESGRTYRISDNPEDGYFPDDEDGLVDIVSVKGDHYFAWKRKRFSERLFSVLTEKYKKISEKRNSVIYKMVREEE